MPTHSPHTSTHRPGDTDTLAQLQAGLARLVGDKGTQALVRRSRELCANGRAADSTLSHTLQQLAGALLGESLAARLQHLGDAHPSDASPPLNRHH
jgi:hypothetical protein